MNSFLNGDGPENFYFASDHAVSKSLKTSKLVTTAIDLYENGDSRAAQSLRDGLFTEINIHFLNIVPFTFYGLYDEGTILTPEHLIGSAEVRIIRSEDGLRYDITIWNTTSVGSGTVG